MSKQVNYNENLCAGAAIRDDKGRRISKLFEASHPKMTVGYAKNLIMPNDPTEQKFNFRRAGGGVIEDGVAVIDKVKGNSVVWNQMVNYIAPQVSGDTANLTCTREADGRYKIVLSAQVTTLSNIVFAPIVSTGVRAGHKYMSKYGESDNLTPHIGYSNGNGVWWQWTPSGFAALDSILTLIETTDLYGTLYIGSTLPAGTYYFLPTLFDLTQMFGAGNEPSTYEEFLQRKPKVADEYAYNEGTIINNKVEGVKTTGVNLWDEEWELGGYNHLNGKKIPEPDKYRSKNFIPVLSGKDYFWAQQNKTYKRINFYDANRNFISYTNAFTNQVFTTPINCAYITIWQDGTTYNHDLCINISDPTINGKYFPYEKHELDLSWVKDIRNADGVKLFEDGIKSAGTAFDEVGKNKAVKRIRKYVFDGSEPMTEIQLNDDGTAFKVAYFTLFETTTTGTYNAVSIGAGFYSQYNGGYYFDLWAAGFASVRGYVICVPSSIAKTGDEMKEYLKQKYNEGNPLVVYYELADPIEVEYDEKSLTYPVVAGGTEKAIASEPSTAFRADIGYGIDAVKTILDLKARVEALEGK